MGKLAMEIARNKANGDVEINGFTGGIRSLENSSLEIGDEFTIPETFKVFKSKRFNDAQYIMVELKNGNAKQFFPSTFTKSRTVYDENKQSTGVRVHTLGTAAEEFRSHADVAEGMNALKGKTLKVTKIDTIRTLRYDRPELMDAQILTIDIVK